MSLPKRVFRLLDRNVLSGISSETSSLPQPSTRFSVCTSRNGFLRARRYSSSAKMKNPPLRSASRRAPSRPTSKSAAAAAETEFDGRTINFKIEEHTPEFWRSLMATPTIPFKRRGPEYFREAYLTLAGISAGQPVKQLLISPPKGVTIPPQTLHELGCVLQYIASMEAHSISTLCWSLAADAGHQAAQQCLVLAWTSAEHPPDERRAMPSFAISIKNVEKWGKLGEDANNIALYGRLSYKRWKKDLAVELMESAIALNDPNFELRDTTRNWLAEHYIKVGDRVAARRQIEANGYLSAEFWKAWAESSRTTFPATARMGYIHAGTNGDPECYASLAQLSLDAAGSPSASPSAVREHQTWANEWLLLARAFQDLRDERDMRAKAKAKG